MELRGNERSIEHESLGLAILNQRFVALRIELSSAHYHHSRDRSRNDQENGANAPPIEFG